MILQELRLGPSGAKSGAVSAAVMAASPESSELQIQETQLLSGTASYVLRMGDVYADSASARLVEQLGCKAPLESFGITTLEVGGKRKLIGLYTAVLTGVMSVDLRRCAGYRHMSQDELEDLLEIEPRRFSSTFRLLYERYGDGLWPVRPGGGNRRPKRRGAKSGLGKPGIDKGYGIDKGSIIDKGLQQSGKKLSGQKFSRSATLGL